MSLALTQEDGQVLIQAARSAIASRLSEEGGCYPAAVTPALMIQCGAFVTLKSEGSLRGCIGRDLLRESAPPTVKEIAVCSAFEDPRFPPVTQAEWPRVQVEVSVLSPLKAVDDPRCVCVGTHGVLVRSGSTPGSSCRRWLSSRAGTGRLSFPMPAARRACPPRTPGGIRRLR